MSERDEQGRFTSGGGTTATTGAGAPTAGPVQEKPVVEPAKSDEEVRAILEKEFPEEFKAHAPMRPPVAEAAAGETEPEKEVEAAKPDRDLTKAIDFLKRDKVPESVLAKLSPDETKAYAKERKALVVEYQQAQQRIAELEKTKPTIPDAPKTGSGASQPSEVPSLGDLAEAVKGIRDLYGDEAAAPLEKAFGSMQKRLDAIEANLNRASQEAVQTRVNEAREALQERFPQLEEEDGFQEAIKVAAALESAGIGSSKTTAGMRELLERAARNLDWTPFEPQPQEEKDSLALLRANGTASSKSKPVKKAPLTQDARDELAARFALDDSIPVEEARRRLAEM